MLREVSRPGGEDDRPERGEDSALRLSVRVKKEKTKADPGGGSGREKGRRLDRYSHTSPGRRTEYAWYEHFEGYMRIARGSTHSRPLGWQ